MPGKDTFHFLGRLARALLERIRSIFAGSEPLWVAVPPHLSQKLLLEAQQCQRHQQAIRGRCCHQAMTPLPGRVPFVNDEISAAVIGRHADEGGREARVSHDPQHVFEAARPIAYLLNQVNSCLVPARSSAGRTLNPVRWRR